VNASRLSRAAVTSRARCIAFVTDRFGSASGVSLAATSPATGNFTWATGSMPDGAPVTASSPMYAASVTKQFVAALVGRAVLAGRVDPEDSIDRFVALPSWAGGVRVRHLVHHLGGLPEWQQLMATLELPENAALDNARTVRALARVPVLDQEPGREFRYSNTGYVVLAEILRAVHGAEPGGLLRDELLRPLGMTDSSVGRAPRYDIGHEPWRTVGDGGLWTSARDLLVWLQALNARALGDELTELVQSPGHLDDGTPVDYAWGVTISPAPVGTTYTHGGTWPAWTSKTVRNPAMRSAVALLTRVDDDRLVSDVAMDLHRLLTT
jgi:CubicO group peptidase (beta-lactamase class C family)